jgi:Leucine-rich repeat (LRR) protein
LIDKHTFSNNNLLHYLEELHLDTSTNHHLEFLCYGTWKKLRVLKLSGFNFDQFQSCFDKLDRLEKLIIQNSKIHLLSSHIYKLPFLYELSLINNQIENLNFDEQSSSSIRILNLTSNQLRTIPNDLNLRLPHLITLDLSHNFIENIPLMNQITTLNINLSFNLINYFNLNHNQHWIDLSSNPICTLEKTTDISNIVFKNLTNLHCDCRLGFFLTTNRSKLLGDETICVTPEKFEGLFLKDLTYEQLMSTCELELPKNCKEITNFHEIQQEFIIENTTHSKF